jgi:hypothetical protein
MFGKSRGSPRYWKLGVGPDQEYPTQSVKPGLVAIVTSLLCILSFVGGWVLGAAKTQPPFPNVIPSVPLTGMSRQQVLAMPEMQAAPPANGSHEPAWDKLIPGE